MDDSQQEEWFEEFKARIIAHMKCLEAKYGIKIFAAWEDYHASLKPWEGYHTDLQKSQHGTYFDSELKRLIKDYIGYRDGVDNEKDRQDFISFYSAINSDMNAAYDSQNFFFDEFEKYGNGMNKLSFICNSPFWQSSALRIMAEKFGVDGIKNMRGIALVDREQLRQLLGGEF